MELGIKKYFLMVSLSLTHIKTFHFWLKVFPIDSNQIPELGRI